MWIYRYRSTVTFGCWFYLRLLLRSFPYRSSHLLFCVALPTFAILLFSHLLRCLRLVPPAFLSFLPFTPFYVWFTSGVIITSFVGGIYTLISGSLRSPHGYICVYGTLRYHVVVATSPFTRTLFMDTFTSPHYLSPHIIPTLHLFIYIGNNSGPCITHTLHTSFTFPSFTHLFVLVYGHCWICCIVVVPLLLPYTFTPVEQDRPPLLRYLLLTPYLSHLGRLWEWVLDRWVDGIWELLAFGQAIIPVQNRRWTVALRHKNTFPGGTRGRHKKAAHLHSPSRLTSPYTSSLVVGGGNLVGTISIPTPFPHSLTFSFYLPLTEGGWNRQGKTFYIAPHACPLFYVTHSFVVLFVYIPLSPRTFVFVHILFIYFIYILHLHYLSFSPAHTFYATLRWIDGWWEWETVGGQTDRHLPLHLLLHPGAFILSIYIDSKFSIHICISIISFHYRLHFVTYSPQTFVDIYLHLLHVRFGRNITLTLKE